MIRYLSIDDLLHVAERTLPSVSVRDAGLLASAVARPAQMVFGKEAYPGLFTKAAALLHSTARNHALVDGNKRLALAGTIAFLGVNGYRLTLSNDQAYALIMAVASGRTNELEEISSRLSAGSAPW